VLDTGNQVGIGNDRQSLQSFAQVPRTYFAGSTGAVNRLRQSDFFRFVFFHVYFFIIKNPEGQRLRN
jgi:hypothetical protein